MKQLQEIQLTRRHLEIMTLVILLLCAFSVFRLGFSRQGQLSYDQGNISYQGTIVNNRMTGQGKLTLANGDTYEGNLVKGVFEGQGTYTAKVGWSYTGEFKAGQPDGQGLLKALDGQEYKGTFKQGIYQE